MGLEDAFVRACENEDSCQPFLDLASKGFSKKFVQDIRYVPTLNVAMNCYFNGHNQRLSVLLGPLAFDLSYVQNHHDMMSSIFHEHVHAEDLYGLENPNDLEGEAHLAVMMNLEHRALQAQWVNLTEMNSSDYIREVNRQLELCERWEAQNVL